MAGSRCSVNMDYWCFLAVSPNRIGLAGGVPGFWLTAATPTAEFEEEPSSY